MPIIGTDIYLGRHYESLNRSPVCASAKAVSRYSIAGVNRVMRRPLWEGSASRPRCRRAPGVHVQAADIDDDVDPGRVPECGTRAHSSGGFGHRPPDLKPQVGERGAGRRSPLRHSRSGERLPR